VKVHHRYQRQRWQIAAGINDTGANLLPVSTTPHIATGMNDTGSKLATGVNDIGGPQKSISGDTINY
jgi:hypothetical protein